MQLRRIGHHVPLDVWNCVKSEFTVKRAKYCKVLQRTLKKRCPRIPAADEEEVLLRVYSSCPKVVGESSARLDGLVILSTVNAHIRNKLVASRATVC
jgi:hypothetical protein